MKSSASWGSSGFLWLVISVLTGISFVSWFTDSLQLWKDLFTGQASGTAYFVVALFTVGTFVLAGRLREQACFWLCPYARIQGVMYDQETILPTYDFHRGEPRGRLKKGKVPEGQGDCIDCKQCVAVCPTGIDIRMGQQEGCITCSLCIDACDAVMEKIGKPKGLIRYASLDEMEGKKQLPLYKRPRPLIYLTILTLAFSGIIYGLTHLGSIELGVLHERAPLFVQLSDGSIQNKYRIKILNKTDKNFQVRITATGIDGMQLKGAEKPLTTRKGDDTSYTLYITPPASSIHDERTPITFTATNVADPTQQATYESMFLRATLSETPHDRGNANHETAYFTIEQAGLPQPLGPWLAGHHCHRPDGQCRVHHHRRGDQPRTGGQKLLRKGAGPGTGDQHPA